MRNFSRIFHNTRSANGGNDRQRHNGLWALSAPKRTFIGRSHYRDFMSYALAACARCGPLCLFASARQPQAFTINPRFYLYVTRLAQHLALHPRVNVVFPFCVRHMEHFRPITRAANK
jgi:hypothetical protein